MRPRKVKRLLASAAAGAILAGTGIGFAAHAKADPGCETIAWPTLLAWGQKRTICDGPVLADGSWQRERVLWTPAHYVPVTCSGEYFITCSGGYAVGNYVAEDMSYPVTPDTVLPNEPGHLGVAGPVIER